MQPLFDLQSFVVIHTLLGILEMVRKTLFDRDFVCGMSVTDQMLGKISRSKRLFEYSISIHSSAIM